MTELLSIFLTWQFLVLCVGIAAITFVIRTVVEYYILDNPNMPGNSQSRFWRDMFLVILPVILGFVFCFVGKTFPYPTALTDSTSKFLFGSSAGLLSPTLYRVIKALLWKNVSENASELTQQFPALNKLQTLDTLKTADDSKPDEPKI